MFLIKKSTGFDKNIKFEEKYKNIKFDKNVKFDKFDKNVKFDKFDKNIKFDKNVNVSPPPPILWMW